MSLRQAINDPELPFGWKQQVSQCELTDCSLWEHRPMPRTTPVSLKMTSNQCHFEGIENKQGVTL